MILNGRRGRPGYPRVDTVHQGDTTSRPGLYHINAVDTVTQWQVAGWCQTISEAHSLPVLEAIPHQFPFRIGGFHSDNGSEFLKLGFSVLGVLTARMVGSPISCGQQSCFSPRRRGRAA